jgi:hypothetical protein
MTPVIPLALGPFLFDDLGMSAEWVLGLGEARVMYGGQWRGVLPGQQPAGGVIR